MSRNPSRQPRVRSRLRTRINKSARWLSKRTDDAMITSSLGAVVGANATPLFIEHLAGANQPANISQDIIWLDQDAEEERCFNEKLQAFLELEVGNSPERRWLLKGTALTD